MRALARSAPRAHDGDPDESADTLRTMSPEDPKTPTIETFETIELPDPITSHFPGYIERGAVGRGGMAEIVRIHDPRLERDVAAKVTSGDTASPSSRDALVREARITAQLEHPSIVPVHARGETDLGAPYFTMKLVDGVTYSRWLAARSPVSADPDRLADAIEVLLKVCDAVAFAHSAGVVHRDIKPDNIMVGAFGQVYLMDWGIALRTAEQARMLEGTPAFMSPEHASGLPAGAPGDLYSLGAVLYYTLAGRAPFGNAPINELLSKVRRGAYTDLASLDLEHPPPSRLLGIQRRAMCTNPSDRYARVEDLAQALRAFLREGHHLPEQRFHRGERVMTDGDPGSTAYVILSGEAEVWHEREGTRVEIRRLGPGEVFGELAVVTGGNRTASVDARTDLVVQVISREMVERGIGAQQWMGLLTRALASRFAELESRRRGST